MNLNDLFLLVRVLRANLHAQVPVSILDGEGAAARRLQVASLIIVRDGAAIPTRKGEELGEALVLRVRREMLGIDIVKGLKE